MKSKFITAAIAALGMAVANAASAFDFSPGPTYSCGTYCNGYITNDASEIVDYVNLQYASPTLGYKVTVSVNGKVFQGYESAPDTGGVLYNVLFDYVNQTWSSDGTFITLSNVSYTYKHTCVRSGRGQHCTSWYWIVSGTVN